MHSQNKFILELCKFENTNKNILSKQMCQLLDYPYILGQLLYNRVGAIAYHTLYKNDLLYDTNREFRNTLKSVYRYNTEQAKSFKLASEYLSNIFEGCNCFYAFLKGAFLVDLYPEGLRTSNDIDILVRPQNITEICAVLKNADFKQGKIINDNFVPANRSEIISSRMNRGETVPFVKEIGMPNMQFLEVDINFSLGFMPGADEEIVSEMLRCSKPLINGKTKTLDEIDFFIHLCAHLYKEATTMKWVEMGRDISLYKFCDIYLYLNRFLSEPFCNKLIKRVDELDLQKECCYAVYYTKKLFNIENTQADRVLEEIEPINTDFLNSIFDPKTNKKYCFNMDYMDWVFCKNRKDNLYEA